MYILLNYCEEYILYDYTNKCIHVLLSIYDVHCKLRISILYMSVHVYVLCVMIVSDVSTCVLKKAGSCLLLSYLFIYLF